MGNERFHTVYVCLCVLVMRPLPNWPAPVLMEKASLVQNQGDGKVTLN